MRIVITGYPNAGKTTLANVLMLVTQCDVLHTDKLIDGREWSTVSSMVADWLDKPGPWIIEGVAAARAIRKWRIRHPGEKPPCDMFIYMRRSFDNYRPGQRAMANGMDTVMVELWHWMIDGGVMIFEFGPNRQIGE